LAVRKLGLCVGSACFPGRASGRARAGRARRFLGTDGGAGSRRHAACARRGFGFRFHEPLLRAGNWISGLPSTTPRVPSHLHDFVASLSLPLVAGPYPPSAPPYYRLSSSLSSLSSSSSFLVVLVVLVDVILPYSFFLFLLPSLSPAKRKRNPPRSELTVLKAASRIPRPSFRPSRLHCATAKFVLFLGGWGGQRREGGRFICRKVRSRGATDDRRDHDI
jgi:hypothetical protein